MSELDEENEAVWLDAVTDWLHALAADLRHVLHEVGRLVRDVAEDWDDRAGRDWRDRAHRLERDLEDQVAATGELVRRIERVAATEQSGPRLGGLDGARVVEGYGPRVPTLPPPR